MSITFFVFSLRKMIPVNWECCCEGHFLVFPQMTLMYVQEVVTLHVRGIDACIYDYVGITTHGNANIDVREQANSAPQCVRAQI